MTHVWVAWEYACILKWRYINTLPFLSFPFLSGSGSRKNKASGWFSLAGSVLSTIQCFVTRRRQTVKKIDNPLKILHRVSEKTVQISFWQNFVQFPPILVIFGRMVANRLKYARCIHFPPHLIRITTLPCWMQMFQIVTHHWKLSAINFLMT